MKIIKACCNEKQQQDGKKYMKAQSSILFSELVPLTRYITHAPTFRKTDKIYCTILSEENTCILLRDDQSRYRESLQS